MKGQINDNSFFNILRIYGKAKVIVGFFVVLMILLTYSMPIVKATENVENNKSEQDKSEEISGEIEVIFNVNIEIMQEYIDAFENKYPNVKVTYTHYNDYEKEMKKRFESGDIGDVLYTPSYVDTAISKEHLEPLGTYDELAMKYNYMKNAHRDEKYVYSIPNSAYLTGIIYNSEVFDKAGITEAPKSMEDFLEDLALIEQNTDAIPFHTGYAYDWALGNWSEIPYIPMTGSPNYKGNEFIYVKDPFSEGKPHYEVYKLLYDIVKNGYAEPDLQVADWYDTCKKLCRGDIGCVLMGSWAIDQVKIAGENSHVIGFMPFPHEINGKKYMNVSTDYNYAISKHSDNKEAARAFLDYMLDESGYAIDQERISIVKTDPYADVYGDMSDVVLLENDYYIGDNYEYYKIMSQAIDPSSNQSIKRIVAAAGGLSDESYDDIMNDWNTKWENAKPAVVKDYIPITSPADTDSADENKGTISEFLQITDEYDVGLSQAELDYIMEKKYLIVGYLKNMAPFQYKINVDDGGYNINDFQGVAAQICDSIENSTGLIFEYVPYDSTEELITALENGEIDMAAGIESLEKYTGRVKFSKDYIEYMKVIIKNDTVDTNNLNEGIRAIIEGEETEADLEKGTKYSVFENIDDIIECIENMDIDYTISNFYTAEYYIRDVEAQNVVVVPMTQKTKLCFAYSKNVDARLVAICNKCIYSISDDGVQVMLMEHLDPPAKEITLWRFIKANPLTSIVIAVMSAIVIAGGILTIIHERMKSARKHEIDIKRYKILSQLTDEYVFEYDYKTNTMQFDKKFQDKFNFSGRIVLDEYNFSKGALNKILEKYEEAKNCDSYTSEPFEIEDIFLSKQWYKMVSYRIQSEDKEPRHLIAKLMNVHETTQAQLRIQDKVERDELTQLYNRTGFEKKFNEIMNSTDKKISVTFAVLDYDNFKGVNDSLGHTGGDYALIKLAENLKELAPKNVIAARYGGDEFMLCIYNQSQEEAQQLIEKLVKDMDTKIVFQGCEHKLSISLGAVYAQELLPFTVLFVEADRVLYAVKANGKNSYRLIKHLDEI